MQSPTVDSYDTTYSVAGDDTIEKPRFVLSTAASVDAISGDSGATSSMSGRMYINATQCFGSVPETTWNFYIGGYQPAQDGLKTASAAHLPVTTSITTSALCAYYLKLIG